MNSRTHNFFSHRPGKPLIYAISVLLFLLSAFPVCAQDFTIESFDTSVAVSGDSSFTVNEVIRVVFHHPRHGIFREIPYVYIDSQGEKIKTPLTILSVTDGSGEKVPSDISRKGNTVHIRIGDPDSYVSGPQTYVISYKVENALLFFEDHDELYWNVTGNYWRAPIRKASCTVRLATDVTKEYWASCYTGRMGSTDSECTYAAFENSIEFKSQKELLPGEGFTIAYGWSKGLVHPPSSLKKLIWMIDPARNWVFLLPLFSATIMFTLWLRRGRDPVVRESVVVRYSPPEHNGVPLHAAATGALVDETLDPRDITATIVGLAVKGYLKFEEVTKEGIIFDSTDYYIEKLREPDDAISRFEKELIICLFGSEKGVMVSDLKNRFYKKIDALKKTVYGELVGKNYFLVSPDKIRKVYSLAGIAAIFGSIFLLDLASGDSSDAVRPFVAGGLTGLPLYVMSKFMPAKTRKGSEAYMVVMGFEEFLVRAEKDRLVRMGDENLFSKFLPYAIALNVADNWAKAFEGIYQQPPEWYVSSRPFRTFNTKTFTSSFNSTLSNLSAAMYSAPRGSGTGGFSGGSSGGGFGGGGGGSW